MPALSLDCLTLTDTTPMDLIRGAHHAGFDLVSLWTAQAPPYPKMAVTRANLAECKALLAQTGIRVGSIDAFEISSKDAVPGFRPALELGAELGGKAALAYHWANPDRPEVEDALGLLAELAGEMGLGVNIEPIAVGMTRSVADAQALIAAAGVDAGILFDTYHFMRQGGGADNVGDVDPSLIRYVQVNDGPASVPDDVLFSEATQERMYPGDGEFPLTTLLRRLPRDVPWGIEAPSLRRAQAGIGVEAMADEAMQAMQRELAKLDREAGR